MQGIILAGGAGKRLLVNGQNCSKPMTFIGGKELIRYSIDAMLYSDINQIIIVYQETSKDVLSLKESYGDILTFVKDCNPDGKLKTLLCAKEHIFKFPLVVSYSDIVVEKDDFKRMMKTGLEYDLQKVDLVIQTVINPSIAPSDDEPWDKSIIVKDDRIVEWVRGGAKFNPEEPDKVIRQGGMVYLWFSNPFESAENFIANGHSSYAGFMYHYIALHNVYEMQVADIWDIDKPDNIQLSEKTFAKK